MPYLAHANVYGVIVERGAGGPAEMDALRQKAGKPDLPVWFVALVTDGTGLTVSSIPRSNSATWA
jgi:hypothetical protein